MDVYRVVCTTMKFPADHRHIISIGTGDYLGHPTRRWTVQEVWDAMRGEPGAYFFTRGADGTTAWVAREDCVHCGLRTLRSHADATVTNNLASLPDCAS